MAATSNQVTTVDEIKTGRGVGPVTTSITLSQAIVGLIYILLAHFGIVLPIEVMIYGNVIVAALVGYFTKGRAYVRDTKTIDDATTPPPVIAPIPDGTGEHRAEREAL